MARVDEKHLDDFLGRGASDALQTGAEKSVKYTVPATALATLAGGPVAGLAVAVGIPAYSALWELLYGKHAAKAKDKRDLERFKQAQKEVLRQNDLLVFQDHKGNSKYVGVPKQKNFAISKQTQRAMDSYRAVNKAAGVPDITTPEGRAAVRAAGGKVQTTYSTGSGAKATSQSSNNVAKNIATNTGKSLSYAGQQTGKAVNSINNALTNAASSTQKTVDWAAPKYQNFVVSRGQNVADVLTGKAGALGQVAGAAVGIAAVPLLMKGAQKVDEKIRSSQLLEPMLYGSQKAASDRAKYGGFAEDEKKYAFDGYFISSDEDGDNYSLYGLAYFPSEPTDELRMLQLERLRDFLGTENFIKVMEMRPEDFSEGDFALGALLGKAASAIGKGLSKVGTKAKSLFKAGGDVAKNFKDSAGDAAKKLAETTTEGASTGNGIIDAAKETVKPQAPEVNIPAGDSGSTQNPIQSNIVDRAKGYTKEVESEVQKLHSEIDNLGSAKPKSTGLKTSAELAMEGKSPVKKNTFYEPQEIKTSTQTTTTNDPATATQKAQEAAQQATEKAQASTSGQTQTTSTTTNLPVQEENDWYKRGAGAKFADRIKAGLGSKQAQARLIQDQAYNLQQGSNKVANTIMNKPNAQFNKANNALKAAQDNLAKQTEGTPAYEAAQRELNARQIEFDTAQKVQASSAKVSQGVQTAANSVGAIMVAFPGATAMVAKAGKATLKAQTAKAKAQEQEARRQRLNAQGGMG